jgi:hypothetical protein
LELSFKPYDDDDILTTEADGKITLRYLVREVEPMNPDEMSGDENLFLVNYHRDFYIRRDGIIAEAYVCAWFNGERIPQQETYWIFPLGMYSHSGVILRLGSKSFVGDSGGWDSSMVGVVLASKREWHLQAKAEKVAECLVQEWNNYLHGDVWGYFTDVFDAKTKARIDAECESCWNYNGTYREALESMKRNEM